MQFLQALPLSLQSILLLLASNVFMTFAWYGHLKNLATAPWYIAAFVSWGIALAEYLLLVLAVVSTRLQIAYSILRHQSYSLTKQVEEGALLGSVRRLA